MSRDHLVHVYACVDSTRRTLLLFVKCTRRACRTIACVCDARDQRFQDGTLRAAHRGSKTSVGGRGLGGALEVHTVIVLSRTDMEPAGWERCRERASEPSAPVALRSCLEMSVMEERWRG